MRYTQYPFCSQIRFQSEWEVLPKNKSRGGLSRPITHYGNPWMPSYQELIARKNELDKRIEEARHTEAKEALATIKQLIDTFGFTVQQVFPWKPEEKKKAEAKYYDPESGASWSGRGKPPKWLEGKDRSLYEIKTTPSFDFNAPRDENNPFPVQ